MKQLLKNITPCLLGLLFCTLSPLAAAQQEEHPVKQFFAKLTAPFAQKKEVKVAPQKKEVHKQVERPLQKKKSNKKKPKAKKNMLKKMVTAKAPQESWASLHEEIQATGYYGCPENESFRELKPHLLNAQPAWPFTARNFLQKDTVEVEVSASFADKGFFDTERTTLSPLIFGKKKVQLQDFLLVSRLLNNEQIDIGDPSTLSAAAPVSPANQIGSIYKIYAEEEIAFKTSYNSQIFQINYAHQWLNGKITTGIMLPIVRKSHHITYSLPSNNNNAAIDTAFKSATIQARNAFLAQNTNGIENFIENILYKKNIEVKPYNDNIGCGDITFFAQTHADIPYCQEAHFGLQLTLPIGKTRDTNKLWSPDLGNGGFTTISGHCAFMWHGESSLLNPHIYSQLTYSMVTSVDRRIPVIKNYEGINPGTLIAPNYFTFPAVATTKFLSAQEYMLYGNAARFNEAKKFTEPDSTVKELSDRSARVYLRPGVVWKTRLGNLFKDLYFNNLSCNLYYDVEVKESDSIGFYANNDDFDRNMLTKNTNGQKHAIGFTMQYQFDENYRLNAGFDHVFAGKNCMQTFQFFVNVSSEF
jgi:hypothetical protein